MNGFLNRALGFGFWSINISRGVALRTLSIYRDNTRSAFKFEFTALACAESAKVWE